MTGRWWEHAACAGLDPDLFCRSESSPGPVSQALAVCRRCPVRVPCRDDMLQVRPRGPYAIVAGGWYWDNNGAATPYPSDAGYATQIVAAARERVKVKGLGYSPRPTGRRIGAAA